MPEESTSRSGMRVYRFEQPIEKSLVPRVDRPRRSRWIWLGALGGVVLLLAVFGIGAWALSRPLSGYPTGTAVDGIDIGGLTRAQAAVVLEAHGQDVIDRGLAVSYQGNRFVLDPRDLQLRPRVPEALDAAGADLDYRERAEVRLGRHEPVEVPLTFAYDARRFARAMVPVRQVVNREPVSALAEREQGRIRVTPATDGVTLDGPALRRAVRSLSQNGPSIEVPVRITEPDVTTEEAEAAAENARLYMRTPHVVVLGDTRKRIPVGVVRTSVDFDARGGRLVFVIRQGVYRAWFGSVFKDRERPARNAVFTATADGRARIIGGKNGRGVDVPKFVATLQREPGKRVIPITIGPREPDLTTEEARNLGVTRVVGEFTTGYSGGARVTNIRLAAKILDQKIIPIGGTFSLNDALGQRTADRGFVKAPMIGENNVLVDSVGGGVSQVATTVFNAAFFSGLKIISHTPHSFWISRYPKGREATVSWRSPELIFENNWDAPVVILASTDDTGITIRFLSKPLGRKVVVFEGEPRNPTRPSEIRILDRSLPPGTTKVEQSAGSGGFTIDYGRTVYQNGKELWKDEYVWRYSPQNAIIRFNPAPEPGPEPEPDEDGGGTTPDGGGDVVPTEPAAAERIASRR